MAKKSALVFGIIFIVVGLLGFVNNPVIGLFNVNGLHDIVHIILGIILVWAALKMADKSAAALKWVGIIYLVLAIIGFIWGLGFVNVMAGNDPDNWLHLVLGIVLLAIGLAAKKGMAAPAAPMTPQM
jgi:hypothetical protein